MNVYEKLAAARLRFIKGGAKKSGRNTFTGTSYFELADILPVVNQAAEELGFCCVVRFGKERATLAFVDSEKPEDQIVFTSPMSTADLKNNHAVQNLGAAETYIRRYLYLAAFEIVECDALDAGQAPEQAPAPQEAAPAKGKEKKAASSVQSGSGKVGIPAQVEMGEEIRLILEESAYPDGRPVFTDEDKAYYRARVRADKNYAPALALLKDDLGRRLAGKGA